MIDLVAQFEDQTLDKHRIEFHHARDKIAIPHGLHRALELVLEPGHLLAQEAFHFLAQGRIFGHHRYGRFLQVVIAFENIAQDGQFVLTLTVILDRLVARNGLDAADPRRNRPLGEDLEQTDPQRIVHMRSSAQLITVPETDGPHPIAVLLAEQSRNPFGERLAVILLAVLLQSVPRFDVPVHQFLHLPQLLVGHLGEMREVKTESLGTDGRTFLLDMGTQYRTQCLVQ